MQPNSQFIHSSTVKKLTTVIFAGIAATAILTSLWLASSSNYGGHHDIYLMLGTFLSVLRNGDYVPSRFTGYPVAELGIGAAAWAGGSSLSNSINYLLFLGTTLLFPFCFHAKVSLNRYLAFAALALTSTVMAFDNILSIDYPWSVFFWVLGTLCLRRCKQPIAALVPLGVSIGCRPIFAIFVCASLLLVDPATSIAGKSLIKRLKERWVAIATTLFIGGLFYLPAWLKHGFGLSWISASPPDNQGLAGLVARFAYKLIQAVGMVQSALILCLIVILLLNLRYKQAHPLESTSSDTLFLASILIINLAIFARMPVQLSYLQPFLLCIYYAISRIKGSAFVVFSALIAGINLVSWRAQPQLFTINYQSNELCSKTVGTGISFDPGIGQGRIDQFRRESQKSRCYKGWFGQIKGPDYSEAIVNGRPLRSVQ